MEPGGALNDNNAGLHPTRPYDARISHDLSFMNVPFLIFYQRYNLPDNSDCQFVPILSLR